MIPNKTRNSDRPGATFNDVVVSFYHCTIPWYISISVLVYRLSLPHQISVCTTGRLTDLSSKLMATSVQHINQILPELYYYYCCTTGTVTVGYQFWLQYILKQHSSENTLQPFEIKPTYTSALQEVPVSIFCFTVQQFGISTTERIFKFSSVLKSSCNF